MKAHTLVSWSLTQLKNGILTLQMLLMTGAGQGEANLYESTFLEEADFSFARFQEKADFFGTNFEGLAKFLWTNFQGDVELINLHPPQKRKTQPNIRGGLLLS